MVGKIVRSRGEVSDAESRYEPPKRGSKDDPIVLSDSEEVDQEDKLEVNKRKWDAAFNAMLDEEQQVLVLEYMYGLRDALPFEEGEPLSAWLTSEEDYKKERDEMLKYDESTKKKLKGDPDDMDFEMNYARVNEKDYQDSNDDEDEEPKTPPHYHSDEFYEDSLSEEQELGFIFLNLLGAFFSVV
ncbi:hypothetical protein FNV43_RR27310 [Rhamnella rubrinervis]|uniref:Uncharacterized protein n=1 Tax=Rhamnella rubrinervis TaxID=2594499 RepID=A0A8K0DRK2_9ROSA|nr:hypothetical protein FNV43_RR27310 [Rhamnella rubrinervis]